MMRGPSMHRGIALAIPLALKRGHVMIFVPSLLNLGDFIIAGNGWFVFVRIRYARKFYASIPEIETEFRDEITGLSLVPRTGPVSCELWLYSRYEQMRHFRVGDPGLVELDCHGTPLDELENVAACVAPTGTGTPAPTGPATPGTAGKRGPILRYLARWNAARIDGTGEDVTGRVGLKKILDAVGPVGDKKQNTGKKLPGSGADATGPADQTATEKKPEAGRTVTHAKRKSGKKPAGGRADRAEEQPATEIPASPADPVTAHGDISSGEILGSPEPLDAGSDPAPVPGMKGEEN